MQDDKSIEFSCEICNSSFSRDSNLRKHLRNLHHVPMSLRRRPNTALEFQCTECSLTFTRKSNLKRHLVNIHDMNQRNLKNSITAAFRNYSKTVTSTSYEPQTYSEGRNNTDDPKFSFCVFECDNCGDTFRKKYLLIHHMKRSHLSNISDFKLLANIIPDWPNGIYVIRYTLLNEDRGQFFSKFSINIKDKTELNHWLSQFQAKNKITLRKRSVHPSVKPNLSYQVKYACHHNTKPRHGSVSRKHTKCPAHIHCKIFTATDETRNFTEIRISHIHNHDLNSLDVLKFREPLNDVKNKFRAMFLAGITPAQALLQHRKDLEQQYAEELPNIIGDRGICPNKAWVYYYRAVCLKTIESSEPVINKDSRFSPSLSTEKLRLIENSISGNVVSLRSSNHAHASENSALLPNNISLNKIASTLHILTNTPQSQNLSRKTVCCMNNSFPRILVTDFENKYVDKTHLSNSTVSHHIPFVNETKQILEMKDRILDDVFREFDKMNDVIKNKVRENELLVDGLKTMIRNFYLNLNGTEMLNAAMRQFGSSLYDRKEN